MLAERFGDRGVHGLHRPHAGDVDRLEARAVASNHLSSGPQRHLRAVGGLGGVLDQLAAAVDPHRVVGVRLIGLQQGELGVVAEVDALVAEGPAELEDPLHTADAQPLEVQLRGDPQEQVQVVGVDVGDERAGGGTRRGSAAGSASRPR